MNSPHATYGVISDDTLRPMVRFSQNWTWFEDDGWLAPKKVGAAPDREANA